MTTRPELTDAAGTPEKPLPGSPALTAHDDDMPRSAASAHRATRTQQEPTE